MLPLAIVFRGIGTRLVFSEERNSFRAGQHFATGPGIAIFRTYLAEDRHMVLGGGVRSNSEAAVGDDLDDQFLKNYLLTTAVEREVCLDIGGIRGDLLEMIKCDVDIRRHKVLGRIRIQATGNDIP